MNLLKYLLLFALLLLALPIGFLLARATREELKQGRKAFKLIIVISAVTMVSALFLNINLDSKTLIISSLLFISLLAWISLKSSYTKK